MVKKLKMKMQQEQKEKSASMIYFDTSIAFEANNINHDAEGQKYD